MKYKLICTDLDGTLLNDEKEISKRDAEALRKAYANGVKVAFSTGRIYTSAKFYAHNLGISPYIVSSNGGYVRSYDEVKPLYNLSLNRKQFDNICSIIEKYKVNFLFNTSDTIITTTPFDENDPHVKTNKVAISDDLKIKFQVLDDIRKAYDEFSGEILKALFLFNEDISIINDIRCDLLSFGNLDVSSSSSTDLEILPKGICKFNGINALAKTLNINPKEIVYFGDSENDSSMIQGAGLGIAMGNASEDIKAMADYITDTNCNSGIAKAIDKFILE